MSAYSLLLAFHAIVAVLGVGQLGALARSGSDALFLPVRIALALMFISGAALEYVSGGAWHDFIWFRASVGLLVASGVLLVIAKRNERRRKMLAWICCALIAIITTLMELKPA
jgi:hypothetical protein